MSVPLNQAEGCCVARIREPQAIMHLQVTDLTWPADTVFVTLEWHDIDRLACCAQPADGSVQASVADRELHAVLEVHCTLPAYLILTMHLAVAHVGCLVGAPPTRSGAIITSHMRPQATELVSNCMTPDCIEGGPKTSMVCCELPH